MTRSEMELWPQPDRKSTRLNSSHLGISYAVFCLKKKKKHVRTTERRLTHIKCVYTPVVRLSTLYFALSHDPLVVLCPLLRLCVFFFFFFNDTATTEIYTLSLHDALPILSFAAVALLVAWRSYATLGHV